jgi:hypothetical protein
MTYCQNEHINQSFETNAFESTFILVAIALTLAVVGLIFNTI